MESCSSSTNPSTPISLCSIYSDIIRTHILTKLDGPTLATVATASPLLNQMCNEQILWRDICNSTWTSANDPRVSNIISTFPAGHRSFLSNSFPTLHHHRQTNLHCPLPTSELISAVDIKYNNMIVHSKVQVIDTVSKSFRCSTFWVDLLHPEETIATPITFEGDDNKFMSHIEDSVTLSWILIDPTQKRAANVSSFRPVLVRRHWVTGDIQLRYATTMTGHTPSSSLELVEFRIGVTCGVKDGGELSIQEVDFKVADMDGKCLSGEESLLILQQAIGNGDRRIGKKGEERERYQQYVEMRRARSELMERRQMRLDKVYKTIRVNLIVALFFILVILVC